MSGILVEITSTDYQRTDFLWYWVYYNPTFISGDDATVIAGCSGKRRVADDYFPHVGLTPGDVRHYWAQGAYGDRETPTLSALTYLGHDTAPPNNGDATAPALLGRNTAGSGPIEVLSPATVKAMLGAGSVSGLAELDSGGKVPTSQLPDTVLGALEYQGTWNASTNSPAIPTAASGNKGWYYVVSTAGTTSIGGIADWEVGDWIVSNGAAGWAKIDNSDKVSSVAGLNGAISASALKTALAIALADVTDASANGRSLVGAANYAAMKTLLAIAAGDVSGLATVATTGSASNLGSGTLPEARLSATFTNAYTFTNPTAIRITGSDANGLNQIGAANTAGTILSGSLYYVMTCLGPTAFGVADWANTTLWESYAAGGKVIGTFGGTTNDIILQRERVSIARVQTGGFRICSGKILKLGNAFQSGAPTPNGYVTLQDDNGDTVQVAVYKP